MSKILFAIILIGGICLTGKAQTKVTVTGTNAAVRIVDVLTLTKTESLHFGTLAPGTSPGTCVLTTGNVRNATGGVVLSGLSPVSKNAAFHVTGTNAATYTITLPADNDVVLKGPGADMKIVAFTSKPALSATDAITSTLTNGSDDFSVGGTLNVNGSQAPGLYEGLFDVSVDYN